jgi:hypothetical protein
MPTFASVRVEYADGTFREFHVHKPIRADITIDALARGLPDLDADLGALPPGVLPPSLPKVEIRMEAGRDLRSPVMTIDSRTPDPRTDRTRLLALLSEAADLRRMYGSDDPATDDLWRDWERKTEALLLGEAR